MLRSLRWSAGSLVCNGFGKLLKLGFRWFGSWGIGQNFLRSRVETFPVLRLMNSIRLVAFGWAPNLSSPKSNIFFSLFPVLLLNCWMIMLDKLLIVLSFSTQSNYPNRLALFSFESILFSSRDRYSLQSPSSSSFILIFEVLNNPTQKSLLI